MVFLLMCVILNMTKFSFNCESTALHLSLLFELHPKIIFITIHDVFLMANLRKKTGVPHHGCFRLSLALVTLLICFSLDRLTCPLNSAVVLASYAVQCKSPRERFMGQTLLTNVLRKSVAFPV